MLQLQPAEGESMRGIAIPSMSPRSTYDSTIPNSPNGAYETTPGAKRCRMKCIMMTTGNVVRAFLRVCQPDEEHGHLSAPIHITRPKRRPKSHGPPIHETMNSSQCRRLRSGSGLHEDAGGCRDCDKPINANRGLIRSSMIV